MARLTRYVLSLMPMNLEDLREIPAWLSADYDVCNVILTVYLKDEGVFDASLEKI